MASSNIKSVSVGLILIQSGNGTPNHISTKGSIYIDLNTATEYINKDGVSTWNLNGSGGFVLTQAQYDAITGATSPSSSNVFATMSDVTNSLFTGGTITGSTSFTGGLAANTFSATTYQGLPTDIFTTGGTYSNGTTIFTNNTGGTFNVTGFYTGATDVFVTGGTSNDSTKTYTFTNNTGGTFTISALSDINVTGGTYSNGTSVFTNNTGGTFNVTGYYTGTTDIFVTGATYNNSNGTATFTNNSGGTFTLSGLYTGSTDVFVTGGTYSNGIAEFTNNTGGTFSISGFKTSDVFVTGGTYSSSTGAATYTNNTGGTFNVNGFFKPTDDIYTTGLTFNNGTYDLSVTRNDGTSFTQNLGILASDMTITGGTYNSSTGIATFTNNSGGTFTVSGFLTGMTDTYTTGFTYSNNVFTLKRNASQPDLSVVVNSMTGLTVNGSLSATTYLGLPTDIFVTGGTYSNGSATFTNNSGGTFTLSGLYTGSTDVFVTGVTYSNNNFIFNNNTGGTFNVLANTMTGLTVNGLLKSDTISATSINTVDYIVFNTGTTSADTVAGTVYFDNTQKALSYNTAINQLVTVNLGQQSYIRVFNNSGIDIQRGKALEVLSAYSGLPSVTLALNRKNGSNIIGVSSEIIPNGKEGIAIAFGIISDIELTGMTVGSLIYASDTTPGGFADATQYLAFPLSARTNQIGYVTQTGVTDGKLFVTINNENTVLSMTDLERNVLEGNTISTGLFEFTGMTTASTTTFNIAPLKGWVIQNTYSNALTPNAIFVNYSGGTSIPVTNIVTADSTYILITSALTVTQQVTFPTPQQRRENIYLGKVNHPNRTSILNINNTADYDVSPMSSLRDLWSPIKYINQGIIPSPNGANLSFNTSAGTLWGNGINWHNDQLNPNSVSISGKSPTSFFYRTQTGGTSSSVTVIDPTKYDVGGVITSVGTAGSNDATNQRIYLYPTGVINVLYGQTRYNTLSAAIAAIQSETFIPYPNAESTGILIGVISVRNDIVADGQPLTNTDYAKFTLVSKFGESFGGTGGLSTTTLQQAYDNSTTPEIVINAILDGLSIQNGTGNADNTTRLLEGLNTAGNSTSFIRADGYISGTTFQSNGFIANNGGLTATTISASTYLGLPLDVFTTGVTVSNDSISFNRNDSMSAYTFGFSGININIISDDINKKITFSATTGGSSLPTLNEAQIFIGDTLNIAQSRSVGGDINLDYSGLTTIQPNVVTYDKMQVVSQHAVLGSPNLTGGTVEEIPIIDGYVSSGDTVASLLDNISNWDINGIYTGATITGTFQGQSHYNSNYWFTAVNDNIWIRLIRG